MERWKMRPGREWEKYDKVCPRCHAERGIFVEGEIVMVVSLPDEYHPPKSYQWQLNGYIVEWPEGTPMAPLARGFGIFLGDELLTYEEALRLAIGAVESEKMRLIDKSGIEKRMRVLEAAAHHHLTRQV